MASKTYLPPVSIAGYAQRAGFKGTDLVTATAVSMAESGGWLEAVNPLVGTYPKGSPAPGTRDFGLWQINAKGENHPELFDPDTNARAAFALYSKRGFQPWVVYNNGAYIKFVPAAAAGVEHLSWPVVHLSMLAYGYRNGDVKVVQQKLIGKKLMAKGLDTGYYGPITKQAYSEWQKSLGYSGKAADGIPGPTSLLKLELVPAA
jgi:peptidoglycan hydrolase-like protein with peptidoglycan-binding domain